MFPLTISSPPITNYQDGEPELGEANAASCSISSSQGFFQAQVHCKRSVLFDNFGLGPELRHHDIDMASPLDSQQKWVRVPPSRASVSIEKNKRAG
jgi:hypothetical protein